MTRLPRLDDPRLLPFVPTGDRQRLAALWALDARLAQMRTRTSEPMLAAIKLRWWADAVAQIGEGRTPASVDPILVALAGARCAPDASMLCASHQQLLDDDQAMEALTARGVALGWRVGSRPAPWVVVATAIETGAPLPRLNADPSPSAPSRAHRALDAWARQTALSGTMMTEAATGLLLLRVTLFGR